MKINLNEIKDKIFDFPILFDTVRYIIVGGMKKLHKEILEAVNPKEGASILDLGCGTGNLSAPIGYGYIGIDLNNNFLEKARRKYPHKTFIEMDVKELNFKNDSFDKVMMMNLLHHFNDEECTIILEEAARVSKGKVIIEDAVQPMKGFINKSLVNLDRGKHIRPMEEELKLISKTLEIEHLKVFKSGFYKFIIVTARKRI